MKRAFSAVLFLLMLSVSAFAQTTSAPELLNFQGRLAKPDGTPVADGTYTIRFSLWTALTGGTEKWNQTINPIVVKNGTFAVLLGNGNPVNADIVNGDTYLEIKVGNDAPLAPRQRIVSVAYALKANTVPDGAITTAKIADGAITAAKLALGVGVGIPSGYLILGYTPAAPAGYTFTGDTLSNTWTELTALPQGRNSRPSVAAINGKIYVIGGNDGSTQVTTNYIYDPTTGIWTTGAPMPAARQNAAVAVMNGKIHIIGGAAPAGSLHTDHYVYDPVANSWAPKAPVPTATVQASAVASGNTLYFIGGTTGSAVATNFVYDDVHDVWTTKAPMSSARSLFGIALIGQSIYAIGGWSGSTVLASGEVYDIASNHWTAIASMPTARNAQIAAVINGKISVIGGTQTINSGTAPALTTNEEYDPTTNAWRNRPAMPTARYGAGAAVLNNSVYIIGGDDSGTTLTTNEVYMPDKVYYVFIKQ